LKYLLDTNVCIHYLRGKNPLVLNHFTVHPPAEITFCSVVVGELRYGAERSADPAKEHPKIDAFAGRFASLPFDDAAARIFGEIRCSLEARGQQIGPYDTMIAAIALAHNLILVTHNTAEFSRVPGLILEDWEIP
jgi:tRNA(fMet)-specific endonuclease VapC